MIKDINFIEKISIISSFIIFLSPYFLRKFLNLNTLSNTIVSLGILGTFTGIFLGLLTFDVNNITASVPILLEGLKTAFLTSISGLISSIILKTYPKFYGIKKINYDDKKTEVSIETICYLLSRIENSLVGEGDSTLITQIQKFRTSNADKLDKLNNSFEEFAKKVVADSTQSLIEALTQVMRDFNTKINEQFGDNFKHLNESVGRMLDWQKEYKNQIKMMIDALNQSMKSIIDTEQAIKNIENSFELILMNSKSFVDVSERLEKLLNNLNLNLNTINQMAQDAKNAFPIIEENIKKLTEGFSNSVNFALKTNNEMIKTHNEAINKQMENLRNSYEELKDNMNNISKSLRDHLNAMIKDNSERIAKQIEELDKQLADELNKSLGSLGRQLASLSEKFVEDYSPLTEKLQKIVNISESIVLKN